MTVLLRLILLSTRGRFVRWGRLMRHPKYAIGTVAGLLYFVVFFGRNLGDGTWRSNVLFQDLDRHLAGDVAIVVQGLTALGAAVMVSLAWLAPWGRLGLSLKESELHLLLPAPVERRRLILYAVLKGQRSIVFSALLLSLFASSGAPSALLGKLVGVWLLFTLIDLSSKARSMFLLRQREIAPRSALGRRIAVVVPIVALWAVLLPPLYRLLVPLRDRLAAGEIDLQQALGEAARGFSAGSLWWPLAPFRWALAPALVRGWGEVLAAAPVPLALILVLLVVVARSPARFEEASLRQASARARRRVGGRRYTRTSPRARARVPFALPPIGRPGPAVVWKNLLQVSRLRVLTVALLGLLVLVWAAVLPAVLAARAWVYGALAGAGFFLSLLFPLLFGIASRNDLRTDLLHLDAVRTWPVTARSLMLAEIVTPALIGTAGWAFGAGLYLAAFWGTGLHGLIRGEPVTVMLLPPVTSRFLDVPAFPGLTLLVAGALPVVFGTTLLMSAMKNLAVLLFPAWVELGPTAARGVAALGQRLVTGGAMFLALVVAMLPSMLIALAAGLVHGPAGVRPQAWILPIWGLLAAMPLIAEAAALVVFAGRQWARLDPSREILQLG